MAGCAEPPSTAPSRADASSAEAASPGASRPPDGPRPADPASAQDVARAAAQVEPAGAGTARGTVTMTRVEGGVRVQAQLEGLSGEQYHALQVLRGRACDADPDVHLGADDGTPHGGPYSLPGLRHAGDLGSVRGDRGAGRYDRVDAVLDLSGPRSPVGRAVVVRALRDDAAHPGGAAGPVIGCGVLQPS